MAAFEKLPLSNTAILYSSCVRVIFYIVKIYGKIYIDMIYTNKFKIIIQKNFFACDGWMIFTDLIVVRKVLIIAKGWPGDIPDPLKNLFH